MISKSAKPTYSAGFIDSATFAKSGHRHSWLIEKILVDGQPGVLGGAKKTLKTSIGIDMAISLGTGTPFLGKFAVPEQMRVAFVSGESGKATILDTAGRVCRAKGIPLKGAGVLWSFRLPRLSEDAHRDALEDELRENDVKVAIIDPLYLCLLGGGKTISAGNLYEMGPLLQAAGQSCLAAGATPILIHHMTKNAARRDAEGPPTLDDLAFAGIGEYARQWILINRKHAYDPKSGMHELLMTVGGSAGHAGCWDVDVHEGSLRADLSGRHWEVDVRSPANSLKEL